MSLNERLQELRKQKGLSQYQLCEQLQFKRSTYNEWEQGRRTPDVFILVTLADFYGVSLDHITERETASSSSFNSTATLLEDLPEEARRSAEDFIAFLCQRYISVE